MKELILKVKNMSVAELSGILKKYGVEFIPQNLAKPDAYSLLAEVRAVEKALEIMDELLRYHSYYCDVEVTEEKAIREKALKAIQKISEHFS